MVVLVVLSISGKEAGVTSYYVLTVRSKQVVGAPFFFLLAPSRTKRDERSTVEMKAYASQDRVQWRLLSQSTNEPLYGERWISGIRYYYCVVLTAFLLLRTPYPVSRILVP